LTIASILYFQEVEEKPEEIVPASKVISAPPVPSTKQSEDLFSAHDFDIKIDLEVPLPRKFIG